MVSMFWGTMKTEEGNTAKKSKGDRKNSPCLIDPNAKQRNALLFSVKIKIKYSILCPSALIKVIAIYLDNKLKTNLSWKVKQIHKKMLLEWSWSSHTKLTSVFWVLILLIRLKDASEGLYRGCKVSEPVLVTQPIQRRDDLHLEG